MQPAVAAALEAIGIDSVTRQGTRLEPPRDPPGTIAVCIEEGWPIHTEFVDRVRRIAGSDLIEVVTEDHGSMLPPGCFGVIGLEMWVLRLECVARGIQVHMFETMDSFAIDDSNGVDRSWPGYRLIRPEDDWRALVDAAAREMVRARDAFAQRYVQSMLSPSDVGEPTIWSRHLLGQSGTDYEFERVLGLGGTAIVALVRDRKQTPFAAKALSAHRLPVENRHERFEREGRTLIELNHPNVVRVVDLATMDEDVPVLIMEYLEGGSVHERLATGQPPLTTAVRWLRDALRGLSAMHDRDMVHRDLSVKNLLLRGPGEVVVGDFGTVRHLDDATLTASIDRIGSLIYMAPEQLDKPHEAGLSADVYSIGQIGFQLLTGSVPLGNTGSARSHDDAIPANLSAAIESMRAYQPDQRPQDADEALAVLESSVAGSLIASN